MNGEGHLFKESLLTLAILASFSTGAASAQEGHDTVRLSTLSYRPAVTVMANQAKIEIGSHTTTRCYDWDQDGDTDLLVGGGDGRLWLFRNTAATGSPTLAARQAIVAGKRERWGTSYTGLALAHVVGDPLPDLLVSHSDNQVSIHENVGQAKRPRFAETTLSFTVQKGCQGRFDIADWNADGLPDLVTGSFLGKLVWYPNRGRKGMASFGPGQPFHNINRAYNAHPRILDFNHDGKLDLLLGANWGSVLLFLNQGTKDKPLLNQSKPLLWAADGKGLNIRSLNNDDTTPELADFNGDQVLDLVSGGKNGQIFMMPGVSYRTNLAELRKLFAEHRNDLDMVLKKNPAIRSRAFSLVNSLRADIAGHVVPASLRQDLFQQLASLAKEHAGYLQRQHFDLEASPSLPLLAAQFWVILLESLPDSPAHRQQVARTLAFRGGYQQLLVDFGILFIDNNTATAAQLTAMHSLLTSIPAATWDVETITVADWLGPASKSHRIHSRSGINIFGLPLGRQENSFAGDSPRRGVTDVYLICLAHELAHNMLDTVGKRTRPKLHERKFENLDQAAGPDVVYQRPRSRGIDWPATKENFRAGGAWDGNEKTWSTAWKTYFDGKQHFDRAYLRGNVRFFLESPQEAFATLANQYFTDSQLMLEFSKARWDDGYRSNVNQFLLIADYLSVGTNRVTFHIVQPGGRFTNVPVQLTRDRSGRITQLQSPATIARFSYQDGNLVTGFKLTPFPANDP
ncbi:MAG: VCBS repeat-containing protein [Pirellulaceae bacterium]